MLRHIIVGIDVGTYTTKVVVSERTKNEKIPRVIGTGMADSKGLRHGYIINVEEASKSIRKAAAEAEKNSGVKIRRAYVSIGSTGIAAESIVGTAIISRADGEVTTLDITKAIAEAEESLETPNRRIIEVIPVLYKLDGKEIMGRPEGMRGIKLEVKTLFITSLEQHLDNLVNAVTEAGIEVVDVIPSPLAGSVISLSDKQRTAGCVLINIGAETVTLAVFENNTPISLQVFKLGSTDITHDIALGLRIPLEEAEGAKISTVLYNHPKKKLDEIIEARLSDIFELIENHLKKIKRNGLLPAGVILIGGGSQLKVVEEFSKNFLKLPSKIGAPESSGNSKNKIRDLSWLVAVGLVQMERSYGNYKAENGVGSTLKKIKNFFNSIGKQLMP